MRVGEPVNMDHAQTVAPPSEDRWGFSAPSLVALMIASDVATSSTNGAIPRCNSG
jgi:hypothetical protein